MTLEEKLQGLLEGKLVLHTPTQEMFDKLKDNLIGEPHIAYITPPATSDKQQELLQKVLDVTKDISALSKLEDKYGTDVDFGTLVEIRDRYLDQLEDTF